MHQAFELDKAAGRRDADRSTAPQRAAAASDAVAVVARLQKMEELTIDDIALDETQARLTITGVPDQPGIAAAVFDAVADGGIFVDMIVQSYRPRGQGQPQLHRAADAVSTRPRSRSSSLAEQLDCGPVTSSPQVAKLSVSGIGMRSHTERRHPHVPAAWPRPASTST